MRSIVQGVDNVGDTAAKLFADANVKIVSMQDYTGSIFNTNELDVPVLLKNLHQHGGI